MPIIPLVKTGPLPDVPAPVLDRQQRPTVDNRGLMAANQQLADAQKMPALPNSLAAPFEALGAVGQAIQKTGSVFEALATKVQEARTDSQVAEADGQMELARAAHEKWKLETNADPATWGDDMAKRLGTLKEQFGAREDLTQAARQQIGLRLTRYEGQTAAAVMAGAAKETFSRARSAFMGTLDNADETQDKPKFEETLKIAESKGYLYPHEVEALKQRFTATGEKKKRQAEADAFDTAQNSAVALASKAGESAALEALDGGTLGNFAPVDAERIRSTIKQVGNARSAESMDALANGIAGGAITSAARIEQLAKDDPHLPPKVIEEAKRYLASRDAFAEKQDRETNGVRNAVEMRRAVMEYDPKNDPDRTQYFELVKTIGSRVEQSMAGELTGELYKKYGMNPPKVQVRPEIQQNVSKTLDTLFDPVNGAIPWKHPRILMTFDGDKRKIHKLETMIDEAAKARAMDAQTKVEMQINDWFRANPDKANDLPAVKKKLNELIPEGTRAGALDVLQKKLQPAALPNLNGAAGDLRGFVPASDLRDKLPAGLRPHAQDFIDAGREFGLNPKVLAAISAFETGGGTSPAFRAKNNAMGISDSKGPVALDSVRDSIFQQARTLASGSGPYARAATLDQIAAIYAPPGASNDPNGTNHEWAGGVRQWLSRL